MRTLLTPVLLGSAVAATTLPLPAEGDHPVTAEKKAEDPALLKLRQEIPALIVELNHSHFRHREQAQKRLREIAIDWVKTKQTPFPLLSLLQPRADTPPEPRRRLEHILAAHEYEELQLLWRPTMINIPPQWQGRDHPMLTDVLRELSTQTGYTLVNSRMFSQQELQSRKIAFPEGATKQTFWEVGKVVHNGIGNLEWCTRNDNALDYQNSPASFQCVCPCGAVIANLLSFGGANANLSIAIEPKLILGGIVAIDGNISTEKKSVPVRFEYESGWRHVSIRLPSIPGGKTGVLRVTATIAAYESVCVPIEDIRKEQEVQTAYGPFRYMQCDHEGPIGGEKIGVVQSKMLEGEEGRHWWGATRLQRNMVRCQACDGDGGHLRWWHGGVTDEGWSHRFIGEPARVHFIVPRRQTVKTVTFEFPGVPLPQ